MPIRRTCPVCCACAANGHATAAPPKSVMKSCRLMEPLEPQDYANFGLNDTHPVREVWSRTESSLQCSRILRAFSMSPSDVDCHVTLPQGPCRN
jgi:hypothetical protein